ncbi:TBC1 domain family member 1-like isoform X2 [Oppia nitens]|uniref:TBC1 domain family member 1-like isoform X2 n=1 Tax=Oppia nitens TaxID=1686743 RepID=UPI0023DB50BF|nr:TBC1 domain family member 1-like isoform X2 [Oppia nitens]
MLGYNFGLCGSYSEFVPTSESRKESVDKQTIAQGLQKTRSASGLDTILSYCNQYEVMYVCSIRTSQKRALPEVIDNAIEKFKQLDSERNKINTNNGSMDKSSDNNDKELNSNDTTGANQTTLPSTTQTSAGVEHTITLPTTRRFLVKVVEEGSERSPSSTSVSPVPPIETPVFATQTTTNLLLPTTLIPNTQSLDAETRVSLLREFRDYQKRTTQTIDCPDTDTDNMFSTVQSPERKRSVSGDNELTLQKQLSLPLGENVGNICRSRVGSGGSLDLSRPRSIRYQNKTMLFLIGKSELCLISTDKHKVVLNKTFSNISHCCQGIKHSDHFGIVCRKSTLNTPESYVIHVFMCQSDKLVAEIMYSLKQAFSNAYKSSKQRNTYICETCPMLWFHRLCCDMEGVSAEKAHSIIVNRMEELTTRDREDCLRKCHGVMCQTVYQQNKLYMTVLKQCCEEKQRKHQHSGFQEKSVLEKRLSLDKFKEKAKTSISNTFESIFKLSRNESSESLISSPSYSQRSAPVDELSSNTEDSPLHYQIRPRSNTLSEITELAKDSDEKIMIRSESLALHQKLPVSHTRPKPLLNIFMKVGSQSKLNEESVQKTTKLDDKTDSSTKDDSQSSSWRQSIFNRIHSTSNSSKHNNSNLLLNTNKTYEMNVMSGHKHRSKQEIRDLWRSAIRQQMLLNKMNKQNQKIQDYQSITNDKRLKLDYDEIPNFSDATQLWDATKTWDTILDDHKHHKPLIYDHILNAVHLGIPRNKKADVWLFLAHYYKTCNSDDNNQQVIHDIPYRQLLGQLAIQQHAILVDLGRTFPKVAYYAQALGTGQLSLFNILKAYSLYDKEVEYCQGLSFVAGILLLHLNEDDSYEMMKYILMNRQLRKQYKPDMDGLQMQFYQLTRLLYDYNRSLYHHFEIHDITPTLYSAPWFLTLFASQFAISFVTRLFDILFLMGIEAIFRVSLVLLDMYSKEILECDCFESIMEFLKDRLPVMDLMQMQTLFEKVFTLNIKKQLEIYEVEYRVFQEELVHMSKNNNNSNIKVNLKQNDEVFVSQNHDNKHDIQELTAQIHVYQNKCLQLQSQCDTYMSTIKRLEHRVRACEDERDALLHSVNALQKRNEKLEIIIKNNDNDTNSQELKPKLRSDRYSLSTAPVFNISKPENNNKDDKCDNNNDDEEEGVIVVDEDEIDINSDSEASDYKLNRTPSDTSNLSI